MKGIERLIAALTEIDLIAGPQASMIKLGVEDIADIAWLLLYIDQTQGRQPRADLPLDELSVQDSAFPLQKDTQEKAEPQAAQKEKQPDLPPEADRPRQVYLRSQRLKLPWGEEGVLFRSPAASALPNSLDIARALRPLKRRIPSRTSFLIDESATANRIAETQRGVWSPVLKAAPMRWLEIALVIDVGASMAPWQQTIDEFRILLEHHGAFRDVRIWRLATDAGDDLHLYAGMNTGNQQERDPRELLDPTGRRLILVVTDCVSPAWHSGKVQEMLDLWGHSNIVTMVQVFPKRLWTRTALCNADTVQVRAPALNRGNAGLAVRGDQVWLNENIGEEDISIKSFLPVPVITLDAKILANWANMIVGAENTWSTGVVFYQNLPPMPDDAPFVQKHVSSPEELVRQFRSVASDTACKLVNLLSAAPVSFPVIRLIQQAMLPQSQQVHVAEIFLSDLLEEVYRDETTNDPDYVEYDFLPGVREVIREAVSIPDEFQVIEAISTFLGGRYGHLRDFLALATSPSVILSGDFPIEQRSRPFAKIVASVWRHLGGTYETLADNLEQYVDKASIEDTQEAYLPPHMPDNTAPNLDQHDKDSSKLKISANNSRRPRAGLRRAREERGWLQQELAERLGTNNVTISRWENGSVHPSLYFRQRLCQVFGKTLAELDLVSMPDNTVPNSQHDKDSSKLKLSANSSRCPRAGLRNARLERGWTQQELANQLGTTRAVIIRWENGSVHPSPYFRQRLCIVLGKTLAELDLVSTPGRAWTIPIVHTPFFTGRDDLLTSLHERLSTAKTAAFYGLGGIGKTRTAAEYAFRYGEIYTHVFWVYADTRDSLLADFVKLAQSLNLPEKDDEKQARIVAAVQRWLANHEGWLLIMDNADDLRLALEFLPPRHNGHILFTTRTPATDPVAFNVEVEKLTVQEGMRLLLRWCGLLDNDSQLNSVPAAERARAERIVQEMDGLPLAIVQVGAFVQETSKTLSDYLDLYTTHRKELLARSSRQHADHPETVATTWSLSFLMIEQQSPTAADLLRLLAFLASESLPEELLTRGTTAMETPLAIIADPLKFQETLGVLHRYSLIQRNPNTHSLSIHRLVQTILKDSMDDQTQRAWAELAVLTVNAAFPDANPGNTDAYYQSYLPHIQQCATLIDHYHLYSPESARLLFQAGVYQYFYGFYPQAQSFHQQALAIREQIFGPDHPAVAESLNNLGILYRSLGNYEQAEKFHQQALAIREKTLGPRHLATAESLNNLGVLYRSQGKYEEAEPLLQQALSIRKQSLGSEHLDTLYSFLHLANLYLEQRKHEQAEPLLQEILAKALESEHPLIAHTINLLARLSFERGNYEQAEALWFRSLAIIEKSLGPDHPIAAERLNDLAELYAAQDRYVEAQAPSQRAVSICEKRLGSEHPDTIAYREHLNRILSKIKKQEAG